MFDSSWGVDVSVSTPRIISAIVEEAVSVGDVVRLFSLQKGEVSLVEITLPEDAKCLGQTVEEVELPENATLAAIIRDGQVITPHAHDVFSAGDELLFIATDQAEQLLKNCFIENS
jgi:trk system potassium uptake protein TrkA